MRLFEPDRASSVASLKESLRLAEERAHTQEELVASHLGTITQLRGELEEKQKNLEHSSKSLKKSRESMSLKYIDFGKLAS